MKKKPVHSSSAPLIRTENPLWLPKWASLGLVLAWLYWAGRSYFTIPSHNPYLQVSLSNLLDTQFSRIFNISSSLWVSHLGSLVWLLTFQFSAFHLGDWILKKAGFEIQNKLARLTLAAGAGMATLSLTVFFLAVFHALYSSLLLFLQGALLVFALVRHKNVYKSFLPDPKAINWIRNFSLMEKAASLVLLTFLGTVASVILLPEIFYDSLVYHLALPYLWFLRHYLVPLPFLAFSTMPSLTQVNYCWGYSAAKVLGFLSGDTLAKLLHFSMGVYTVMALYGFLAPRWGRFMGLLSGIFYFAVPAVAMNAWTSGNDVGTGLYQTLAVIALFFWQDSLDSASGDKKWWLLSAVFLGLAMSSKYTALFGVAATFIVAGGFLFSHYRKSSLSFKSVFVPIFYYGLTILLVWSPWLIKNILYTGNPLHPFLFGYLGGQNIADQLKWQGTAKNVFFGAEFNIVGILNANFLLNFITSFWRVAMTGEDSVRYAGPILLLFGPVILTLKKLPKEIKASFAIFILAYFFWFLGNEFARYLAPAYPCMAMTCAFAWTELTERFPREFKAILLLIPLAVAVEIWSPLAMIVHYTHSPWSYLTGQVSRDDFLSYSRPSYPNPSYKVYEYINTHLPEEGTRVLLLGENKAFGLKRDFYYYTVEYNNPILQTWVQESKDDDDLYSRMKREKITHILINYREFLRLHSVQWNQRDKEIFEKFWNKHVLLVPYFAEGTYLYELVDSPPPSSRPPLNLLMELDKRGWKQGAMIQVFLENRMLDEAIDEATLYARYGSPQHLELLGNLYESRNLPGDRERAIGMYKAALGRAPGDVNAARRLQFLTQAPPPNVPLR